MSQPGKGHPAYKEFNCSTCGADKGNYCVSSSGNPTQVHMARLEMYKRKHGLKARLRRKAEIRAKRVEALIEMLLDRNYLRKMGGFKAIDRPDISGSEMLAYVTKIVEGAASSRNLPVYHLSMDDIDFIKENKEQILKELHREIERRHQEKVASQTGDKPTKVPTKVTDDEEADEEDTESYFEKLQKEEENDERILHNLSDDVELDKDIAVAVAVEVPTSRAKRIIKAKVEVNLIQYLPDSQLYVAEQINEFINQIYDALNKGGFSTPPEGRIKVHSISIEDKP